MNRVLSGVGMNSQTDSRDNSFSRKSRTSTRKSCCPWRQQRGATRCETPVRKVLKRKINHAIDVTCQAPMAKVPIIRESVAASSGTYLRISAISAKPPAAPIWSKEDSAAKKVVKGSPHTFIDTEVIYDFNAQPDLAAYTRRRRRAGIGWRALSQMATQ